MKIKTLTIITFLAISCHSSKTTQETVSIEQIETNFPIIVRGNFDENIIFSINFPLGFIYKNESSKKRKINRVDYYYCKNFGKSYYNPYSLSWSAVIMFENREGILERVNSHCSNIEPIRFSQMQEFVVYTSHGIDTTKAVQDELKLYLDKLKTREHTRQTDTLSIGTFKEFKEKHPELTKMLLEGDSISFGIFENLDEPYNEKKDVFITLPILY